MLQQFILFFFFFFFFETLVLRIHYTIYVCTALFKIISKATKRVEKGVK